MAAIALVASFSACTAPRGPVKSAPPLTVAPVLSVDYVLAPFHGDPEVELAELARSREPAAGLRRAWLLLEQKQPQQALDTIAEVLFGRESPSPATEAMARYLRAVAFDRMGQHERGNYDRERARELALDPRLRARLEADAPVARTRPAPTPEPVAAVATQKRSSWNPSQPIAARLDPMERPYRLTVHHSAMYFRDTTPASCAAQIQMIQRSHMQSPDRSYGDIGYHFLIDPAGRVWEGRDLKWQGAHARGDNNRGNIGICMLGNFIRGKQGQRPTEPQLRALRQLVGDLSGRYGIASNQIFSHSDFVQTECPGPFLAAAVADLARNLRTAAVAPKKPATPPGD